MYADQILTLKELKKSMCTAVISLQIEEKTASSSKTNYVSYMMRVFNTAAIIILSTCNIFHSLSLQVGCSFQGKLFSISKLLCLIFVTYYHFFPTSLKNCVLFVTSLRSS